MLLLIILVALALVAGLIKFSLYLLVEDKVRPWQVFLGYAVAAFVLVVGLLALTIDSPASALRNSHTWYGYLLRASE